MYDVVKSLLWRLLYLGHGLIVHGNGCCISFLIMDSKGSSC
jgi:hypothetical protein